MHNAGHLPDLPTAPPAPARLLRRVKWLYGSGDWSLASFNTLRQIFYAIFLTDVVGLDARLASFAALIGILWDALNDPIVGTFSDRLHTRWGRRRPFLLIFAVPFGLSFLLQWWVPPWSSQVALMLSVGLAFMLCDTLQTLIAVPYASLTPELTSDYDERTSLTGHRMFFNLCASLVTAVAAPILIDTGGANQQQGYLLMAAIFGGLAIVPLLLVGLFIRERPLPAPATQPASPPLRTSLGLLWRNVPFRYATLLFLFNWVTFDLVALMLPFFLVYWVAAGDVQAAVSVAGEPLALESAVLGAMLVTSVVALPLWIWLAKRLSKQRAYVAALILWAVVQLALFLVQPGQVGLVIGLAVLAGCSVAAAHVLPDAIFPDVIDWDEVRTHQRREGIYYGIKNFARKLTGAIAIFIALQTLGWSGYQSPSAGVSRTTQSPDTLLVIRVLTGPLPALLIGAAAITTLAYPLTRQRHRRIQAVLARRAAHRARR
ncbi:MAG: MFS transporter [Herpetosiphonaceae bacterium]|nr:MFS transporter [Herpetosiphonaceae bacterium]